MLQKSVLSEILGLKNSTIALLILAFSFLPLSASPQIELSGHLTTYIVDHNAGHDHAQAEIFYVLDTDDGKHHRIKFLEPPKNPKQVETISVKARHSKGDLIVDSYKVLEKKSKAKLINSTQSAVSGDQRTLVILARDAGFSASSYMHSRTSVLQMYFSDASPSLQNYYKSVSENKTSFSGVVTTELSVTGLCGTTGNIFDANGGLNPLVAAIDAGHDLKLYERISIVLPEDNVCLPQGVGGVGTIGKARLVYNDGSTHDLSINWVKSWQQFQSGDNVFLNSVIHEFGHNFGLPHDNANVCGEEIFSTTCSSLEYGGSHSVMGVGPSIGHINSINQIDFGWLSGSEVQTLSSTQAIDQEFTVSALESDDTSLKTVRIPRGDGSYYVIEYREDHGYDGISSYPGFSSSFGGILIYVNDDNEFYNSVLLASDMQDRRAGLARNGAGGNYFDSQLAFNFNALAPFDNVFYDDVNAIRITPISFNSTSARFRVETQVGGGTSQEDPQDDADLQGWSIVAADKVVIGQYAYLRLIKDDSYINFNDYSIASVKWDYDSDGEVDKTETYSLSAYTYYDTEANYQATATITFTDGRTVSVISDVIEVVPFMNYNLRPLATSSASGENTLNQRAKSRFVLELRNPQSTQLKLKVVPKYKFYSKFVRIPPQIIEINPGSIYNLRVTFAPGSKMSRHLSTDSDGYYNIPLKVIQIVSKKYKPVRDYPVLKVKPN